MGIYVNPGNEAFKEAVNSMIYVDKSRLTSRMNLVLNTKEKYVCVSRPRRFGKSMAADMLTAYYSRGCQQKYLNFLRGLFKGSDYVELVYMTGILPIKKYGDHSAINIFDEYSMTDSAELSEYFGFTEKEVSDLCIQNGMDFAEVQRWYDGYLLSGKHIYNPKSVVDVMRRKKIKSYWTGTETYEALKVYIDRNYDGLKEAVIKMLGNGQCGINTRKFQNDMTTFKTKDDVLTLLIHLGYLAYDETKEKAYIPNQEIVQEFLNVVDEPGWGGLVSALNRSDELLKSTWALDSKAVAEGIAAIHNETASMLEYNNENALTCTILMAYYSAKAYYMNPLPELPSGNGFADVVYLPKRDTAYPALVVELKWDKSARGAIAQIWDKEYVSWVREYTGDILLVGINYRKKEKVHECIIEKYVK